jgi:hypothetical protein
MSDERLALPGQTAGAYIEKKWGGPTRPIPLVLVSVAQTATRVLLNNPRRFAYSIINQGSGNVYWGLDSTVGLTTSILIPPLGGSITLVIDEDGEAVAMEAWCIAAGAGAQVVVLEIVRK